MFYLSPGDHVFETALPLSPNPSRQPRSQCLIIERRLTFKFKRIVIVLNKQTICDLSYGIELIPDFAAARLPFLIRLVNGLKSTYFQKFFMVADLFKLRAVI